MHLQGDLNSLIRGGILSRTLEALATGCSKIRDLALTMAITSSLSPVFRITGDPLSPPRTSQPKVTSPGVPSITGQARCRSLSSPPRQLTMKTCSPICASSPKANGCARASGTGSASFPMARSKRKRQPIRVLSGSYRGCCTKRSTGNSRPPRVSLGLNTTPENAPWPAQ